MTTTIGSDSSEWYVGNIRLLDLSGRLLGAHLAHAGLICLWAGSILIKEVATYTPGVSLADQGALLMPHIATFGLGVGSGGEIVDTYPYFIIGVLHLAFSAVYAAGGLYHTFKGPEDLQADDADTRAAKFHYDWDDPQKLSFILGHHLLFLGAACLAFAANATLGGGIYDPTVGEVRLVSDPNFNPFALLGYIFGFAKGGWTPIGMAAVDNMETVIGGHFLIGFLEIGGGIFHIVSKPFAIEAKDWSFTGEAILSYSLGALGLMGVGSALFVANCDLVYPPEFYGADRSGQAAVQAVLAVLLYGGHVWHAIRAQQSAAAPAPAPARGRGRGGKTKASARGGRRR